MRPLPVLSLVAAAAVLAAATGTASAATGTAARGTATPAAGDALSSIGLARVVAAGSEVLVGSVTVVASTLSGTPVAKVAVVPLTSDGTAHGTQEVTPDNSPLTVTAPSTGLPAGLAGFTAPAITATAATPAGGPSSSAGASSLGTLSLLGLPIPLSGAMSAGSSVLGTGASSGKAFEVRDLALPSIADLLAALGLDLSLLGQLAPQTLLQLVDELGLPVDGDLAALEAAVTDLESDLAAARTAVDGAQADVDAAAVALGQAQSDAAAADQALADATDAVAVALLDCAGVDLLAPLCTTLAAAHGAVTAAAQDVLDAEALVATLQGVVDTLQAELDGLLDDLLLVLQPVLAVLAGTPLLSLDAMSVVSAASAVSAVPGGQSAGITGGELTGLEVLGTDVLTVVLGTRTVQVTDLVGQPLVDLQAALDELTGTLAGVLDGAVAGLDVPVPQIALLERSTSTSVTDGFGTASAVLGGLRLSIPAITVPDTLLPAPEAQALAVGEEPVGVLSATSEPVTVTLGELSDSARFRPAALVTPPAAPTVPELARTGGPSGLVAVAGLLLLTGAALVRRRRVEAGAEQP